MAIIYLKAKSNSNTDKKSYLNEVAFKKVNYVPRGTFI